MDAEQLRNLTATLLASSPNAMPQLSATERAADAKRDAELKHKQLKIDQLTHEMATLKRWRFGGAASSSMSCSARFWMNHRCGHRGDRPRDRGARKSSRRAGTEGQAAPRGAAGILPAPGDPPRARGNPCSCGCQLERIGEDVSEKLDYTPGVFTVERHIRGKWVCRRCERLIQAPVPPHVIDKGIPTAGLLAQVLVAKYLDHAPLYRQESIFARAGLALPRSTLAQWVGACGVRAAAAGRGHEGAAAEAARCCMRMRRRCRC